MLRLQEINIADRLREIFALKADPLVKKSEAGHRAKDEENAQNAYQGYEKGLGESVDRYV